MRRHNVFTEQKVLRHPRWLCFGNCCNKCRFTGGIEADEQREHDGGDGDKSVVAAGMSVLERVYFSFLPLLFIITMWFW